MSLQALPSPYEIAGGDNPFYQAAGNIAGFADGPDSMRVDLPGDYDRYMEEASPFLAGLAEGELQNNWPVGLVGAAYGFMRTGKSPLGALVGLLGGLYFPRATAVLYAADAALSHDEVRANARALFYSDRYR